MLLYRATALLIIIPLLCSDLSLWSILHFVVVNRSMLHHTYHHTVHGTRYETKATYKILYLLRGTCQLSQNAPFKKFSTLCLV